MNLTEKQMAILQVVSEKNKDGSATDLDQILERLNYQTTKASIQFSIRALILHGLIAKADEWEKRRGRMRVIIRAIEMSKMYITPRKVKAVAIDELPINTDLLSGSDSILELNE